MHRIFKLSLWFKAIFAVSEIIGSILVYFVTQQFLLDIVSTITQDALQKDPTDLFSNYLLNFAQNFSISTQHFTALYLLSHGVIKLFLIIGLLKEKLWCYPAALVVFELFIVYQLYRFSFTHSLWLLGITFADVLVIWLTWHEYKYLRARLQIKENAAS